MDKIEMYKEMLLKGYKMCTSQKYEVLKYIETLENKNNQLQEKPEPEWHFHKCGECIYLDLSEKTTIGYICNRPNHWWKSSTANKKHKHAKACKGFIKRE